MSFPPLPRCNSKWTHLQHLPISKDWLEEEAEEEPPQPELPHCLGHSLDSLRLLPALERHMLTADHTLLRRILVVQPSVDRILADHMLGRTQAAVGDSLHTTAHSRIHLVAGTLRHMLRHRRLHLPWIVPPHPHTDELDQFQ